MYTDAHIIDSKGKNTENSTLRLTKSNTSQKIAVNYIYNSLVNQLHMHSKLKL